ncbi:hypothetical protein OAU93_00950 [bacterium]|nr:hypothetical protein [bacterium]
MFSKLTLVTCSMLLLTSSLVSGQQQPLVEKYLLSGNFSQGEQDLKAHLETNPKDDQARLGLGTLQFMQSLDHLSKSWYRYGINSNTRNVILPFFRLPVPNNPNPEQIDYESVRQVFKKMIKDLEKADQTLAKIESKDVKLPLHLFEIHFDINGDGKKNKSEDLNAFLDELFDLKRIPPRCRPTTIIAFDYADVIWLRGYTHVLRSLLEFALAYDAEALWDVAAYRIFPKVKFKHEFMKEEFEASKDKQNKSIFDQNTLLDILASFHNANFKLQEPERVKRIHKHLKKAVELSREMWSALAEETDNDREWIPNSRQTTLVSPFRPTSRTITAWESILDETEAILDGKKLLPFWRGEAKDRGFNVNRFLTEPKDFDLILFIHGSGALPHVERGNVTSPEKWRQFQEAFGGDLFGFAIWFN